MITSTLPSPFFIAQKNYAVPELTNVRGPILVTGSGGFIGFHVSRALLDLGFTVVGVDNMNPYYDPKIKWDRIEVLKKYQNFSFFTQDISDLEGMQSIFQQYQFPFVVHLAAQAGVRYSLTHPFPYIQSNIQGFLVLLECTRHTSDFAHMVYASSSSVYGQNTNMPFHESDPVNNPMSLYAATKRANELMAQSYFHLYQIPLTGLRFFTVYGPWGRPDMAAFKFIDAIESGRAIDVYNYGNMARDYTFVGDTVMGILRSLNHVPNASMKDHPVYNLGNNKLETLSHFIEVLEDHLGVKAIQNHLPIQPGDVPETIADITRAQNDFKYNPGTSIEEGIGHFVTWYREYFTEHGKKDTGTLRNAPHITTV